MKPATSGLQRLKELTLVAHTSPRLRSEDPVSQHGGENRECWAAGSGGPIDAGFSPLQADPAAKVVIPCAVFGHG